MIALALVCALAGFAALALAMDRHHQDLLHSRLSSWRRRRLRIIGSVMLAASFPASIAAWGAAFGPVIWFGVLSAGAGIVFLLLAWITNRAT